MIASSAQTLQVSDLMYASAMKYTTENAQAGLELVAIDQLVNWCSEPSQPLGIISGLVS